MEKYMLLITASHQTSETFEMPILQRLSNKMIHFRLFTCTAKFTMKSASKNIRRRCSPLT